LKIIIFETKSQVTMTLTLDDLESHIVVNVSSTLTTTTIWFVAALSLIVDVRTDGHFYWVYYVISGDDLGPVAPISVNFNHQLTQHHHHDNSNSRATSANSSSVKWVSQLS